MKDCKGNIIKKLKNITSTDIVVVERIEKLFEKVKESFEKLEK